MKHRIIEHYELTRRLGAGGSGVVYLANDTRLMRPVVLKILKRGSLTLEQMRTTVLREARMASAIEHPNVCAIYEVGEEGEEAFIVMQYVPGQSLDKLIARGPASVQLVLSVGIQIADGLSAAHSLGIFHRDLKPANVMLTDGGLAKILDFGLARRLTPEEAEFDPAKTAPRKPGPVAATYTARGGTIAYMAPEQFVTGQSSVQSDLWALGVILYELVSGRHPFARPDADEFQSIRAIQFVDPPSLSECCAHVPPELSSVILCCLQKTPAERTSSAAEVRESLKTVMKALQLETGIIPGEAAANLPVSSAESEKRTTGLLSMLAERFRESADTQLRQNTVLVLPFKNFGAADVPLLYGSALADAIAARLARMPSLIVRPSSALMHLPLAQMDPLAVGQKLLAQWVLTGNFLRSEKGFDLNWQLLDVSRQSVKTGGAINVASFDLVAVQTEICNEVFASLQGGRQLQNQPERNHGSNGVRSAPLGEAVSEDYLQARAMLSSFMQRTGSRSDLDRARELFERVTQQDASFAAAWSGLGITHLQYTRHGFGGHMHVLAARRAFDQALDLDPGSAEANLYRIYMLLSRGEKESARHGIEHLLRTAGNDWNVHMVTGITLRLDGMYEQALEHFNQSLRLNPSNAPIIYNHRARVYQYQNQLELAADELQKGLTLEPRHPLLRTSLAYQHMRQGELRQAIGMLENVIRDDDSMRIAYPTLAMCYVQVGERARGAALIEEDSLAAAEADSEMAYRLATYFAVEGDESEALHWLRRAIYLGNENYPWFAKNPAWNRLHEHADFDRILEDLKKSYRRNQKNWKRLLEQVPKA
ncbi:serine/threonine-protein kinase [Acidipila rosea]|uniref:Serine/threonine-protein kinase n=1 Tax=Acidipila rosea TaxID=768535 RepID=A0A4R1LBV8_9BACT|nr:serine/threonine-protein kinase [Acidipila rosea]MBW4026021.1 protein kinase [Acidobacteriota bacterium]MBW4044060.1 protein kinase [Acidobacteriota bacterium]TCK75968.1 serine/threonine-protein kinase [Acidipila rosea]